MRRGDPCVGSTCAAGLWSLVKRAPKASIKRKVFEVPGPKAETDVVPLDVRARQVLAAVAWRPASRTRPTPRRQGSVAVKGGLPLLQLALLGGIVNAYQPK